MQYGNEPLKHISLFRVIDLGVMTPSEKIIETARKEKAGMYTCTCT